MHDEVSRYLDDLKRRLPNVPLRRRFLEEARAHLEECGVERFGPVDVVAPRMRRELAVRTDRLASRLAIVATALFVVPLYLVPENTLPPAPWDAPPAAITWEVNVALAAFAVALAAALAALVWTRALYLTAAALALSAASTVPLVWQWPVGSPWIAAACTAASFALAAAVTAALYTRERACAPSS